MNSDNIRNIGLEEVQREERERKAMSPKAVPLSENSTIRIGLILAIVGLTGGAFFSAVSWAATIQADVRNIRETLVEMVKDHEQRIRLLERK